MKLLARTTSSSLRSWTNVLMLLSVSTGVLLTAASADAEGYGPPRPRGDAPTESDRTTGPIVGIENLFGYASTVRRTSLEAGTVRTEQSTFSFLGGGLGSSYAIPGLSIDGVFGRGVTLGGSLRYVSSTTKVSGLSVSVDQFALAGRVGYLSKGRPVAVWPRVGLAYQSVWGSTDSGSEDAESAAVNDVYSSTALSLELPIVFRGTGFGIAFGPALYVPLSGSAEVTNAAQSGQPEKREVDTAVSSLALVVSGYLML